MTTTETTVETLKINKLTKAQYDNITPSATEAYELTDLSSLLDEAQNLIEVTYSELVTLKANSQLHEGAFYRITDYVTTTVSNGLITAKSETARSAGHAFDIIIQAVGTSNLAEIGTAALHSGDTYFATQNLGAWQIWYDIDNDTNKYKWANSTTGKGVIYRMIDEWGNDLPYDFKNMQFSRNKNHADFSAVSSYLTVTDTYYYTFTYVNNGVAQDYSIVGTSNCTDNIFSACYDSSIYQQVLNNNVYVTSSTANGCKRNTLGNDNCENTLVNNFYGNRFEAAFYNNTLHNFIQNTGLNYFNNNVMTSIASNTYVNQNTFGANFQYARFGTGFLRNTIGNYCMSLTIGTNFKYNTLGNSNAYITIGDNLSEVIINNSCGYINITISNIIIRSKLRGKSSTYFSTSGLPTGGTYPITIQADSNGRVIAYYYDKDQLVGKYKTSTTASTWSAMAGSQVVDNLVTSLSASSTDTQYPSAKCVYNGLDGKQATLVSGTNIKTINNTSLLGSGDISITSTPTDVQVNGTSITSNNVANIVTNTAYNASSNKIATMSDLPSVANMQTTTNLVTSVSSSSTDSQYPSAKLFYDTVGDIESALNTINSGSSS